MSQENHNLLTDTEAPPSPKHDFTERFQQGQRSDEELAVISAKSKPLGDFYKHQTALIDSFFTIDKFNAKEFQGSEEGGKHLRAQIGIYGSFAVNILLFCAKVYAAVVSGSLTVIASALDSSLDLISGSILFLTNYLIQKKNIYKYPAGKTRLEPLGIIVFSAVMFTSTFQLFISSVQTLAKGTSEIDMTLPTIIIIVMTVVLKAILFVYCYMFRKTSSSVEALAQDHRNDIITNTTGVGFALGAFYALWWLDAVGSIVISLYIMINWFRTGFELVRNMSGRSASSTFLQQITYLTLQHDPRIVKIDTVRAYYLGLGFMVEVDIILPESMSLKEAHDIGESLQSKLEQISIVDRAFVHLDYEYQHSPEHQPHVKLDLLEH